MYGFVRIGAGIPKVEVANCAHNYMEIINLIDQAVENKLDILVFPELSVTGYTCGDLFLQSTLLNSAEKTLEKILEHTTELDLFIAVGLPVQIGSQLFNCAAAIHKGVLLGIVPKSYLPNYGEFYEKRWFSPGIEIKEREIPYCNQWVPVGTDLLFSCKNQENIVIGIEICEDLWATVPPSSFLSLQGATVILNLSASNELSGKEAYRRNLLSGQSGRTFTAYCYANAGMGESTTDMVFSGHSLLYEKGNLLIESTKFHRESQLVFHDGDIDMLMKERLYNKSAGVLKGINLEPTSRKIPFSLSPKDRKLARHIPQDPFVPGEKSLRNERCEEIFNMQIAGLSKRMETTGIHTAVIGISGGLDSTLALLAVVKTFDFLGWDRKNIIGITMPGFGTTDRTYHNALKLMASLGITQKEISIRDACMQHFKDIGHDPAVHNTTYENAQARERTQILMDVANMVNGLVIGTGDLSEIALGWSTYNGDHMSMYGINSGIPKTLIKYLVHWIADSAQVSSEASQILFDITQTPVSPELLPPDKEGKIHQKTEELVGPYQLHDFFLYYMVRYGFEPGKIVYMANEAFDGRYKLDEIIHWLEIFYKRFFTQQFKRSCMPDGPKVGSVSLSPRGDWRMPSDGSYHIWMEEIQKIKNTLLIQ